MGLLGAKTPKNISAPKLSLDCKTVHAPETCFSVLTIFSLAFSIFFNGY